MSQLFIAFLVLYGLAMSNSALGEEMRFDTASQWRKWKLTNETVEVTNDGFLKLLPVGRKIDAVKNARSFGGGIHAAGSNASDAQQIMDGDFTTGWSPNLKSAPGSWWLDLDLGRGVFAERIVLNFTTDSQPFELFDVLLSTGEPQVDESNTSYTDVLIFRTKKRFKENKNHRVVFELDQSEHTPIRYVRVVNLLPVEGASLTEIEVVGLGDNLALNLLERGGKINVEIGENKEDDVPLGNAIQMVDGSFFTRFRYGRAVRSSEDVWGEITIDLGAVYWVDWVRLVSGIVPRPFSKRAGVGNLGARALSFRRFDFNLYQLRTSDGSLSPDGRLIWKQKFLNQRSILNSQQGFADHAFTSEATRFLQIRWLIWDANCNGDCGAAPGIVEELMVFGEGFPREVRLNSGLIDLGANKNITALKWGANTPPGTRLEMRSRSGNKLDLGVTFHDKNDKVVTEKKFNKLIPSFRGRIDTTFSPGSDWSPWSNIYSDSDVLFRSPSPRRYIELDLRLTSNSPEVAPELDYVTIEYAPPLAEEAFGEIYPSTVEPGIEEEFSYFVRVSSAPRGFDRLSIKGPSALQFVEARVEGNRVEVEVQTSENQFELRFDRFVRNGQLVELRFKTAVFFQSTRFEGFLISGEGPDAVRQRIDPGNANDEIASDGNVVGIPVSARLLANVEFSSRILTPNNDGINDRLSCSIDLINVLDLRPMILRIYDLSGAVVFEDTISLTAGQYTLVWDGRGVSTQLVAPGIYVVEIVVEGDAENQYMRQIVSVAY